jgi:hypothetical protein
MDTLLVVYHGLFESLLSYGISFWGFQRSVLDRAFIAQKRAVRAMTGSGPIQSCRGTFRELNILTVPALFVLKVLCFIHNNRMAQTQTGHRYGTRGSRLLRAPQSRLNITMRSLRHMGVALYNALPEGLGDLPPTVFKRIVKAHLITTEPYCLDQMTVTSFWNTVAS